MVRMVRIVRSLADRTFQLCQEPVDDVLMGSELVRRAVSMAQAANGLLSSAAPEHP